MLRPILALGGTAAGLAAILSFKTHPVAPAAAPAPAPSGAASAAPAAGKQSAAAKKGTASKAGGMSTARTAHTVTGSVASTQYGPMQVAVTMVGKKITGVRVLRQTDDGAQSQQIDASAIPKLTSETLAAQSAQIDSVSGATYTSEGYKQSLQSALDKPM